MELQQARVMCAVHVLQDSIVVDVAICQQEPANHVHHVSSINMSVGVQVHSRGRVWHAAHVQPVNISLTALVVLAGFAPRAPRAQAENTGKIVMEPMLEFVLHVNLALEVRSEQDA